MIMTGLKYSYSCCCKLAFRKPNEVNGKKGDHAASQSRLNTWSLKKVIDSLGWHYEKGTLVAVNIPTRHLTI